MKDFLQTPLGQAIAAIALVIATLAATDIYDSYTKTDSGKTIEQEVAEIKTTVNENKIHLQYIKAAVEALSSE